MPKAPNDMSPAAIARRVELSETMRMAETKRAVSATKPGPKRKLAKKR